MSSVQPSNWNDRIVERCFHNVSLVAGRATCLFSSLPAPFNANEPNTDYAISPSCNADEVIHWENKTAAGFDLVSSNPMSTALADAKVSRR